MKVGVSGHQNLLASGRVWTELTLRAELRQLPVSTGVSCLAAGTDQIFAVSVLELGWELEAVVPCENYGDAFSSEASRTCYKELAGRATRVITLTYDNPSEKAFMDAGRHVVDGCGLMFFVWDGRPAAGLGGTGDVFAHARSKEIPYVWLNPVDHSVKRSG